MDMCLETHSFPPKNGLTNYIEIFRNAEQYQGVIKKCYIFLSAYFQSCGLKTTLRAFKILKIMPT